MAWTREQVNDPGLCLPASVSVDTEITRQGIACENVPDVFVVKLLEAPLIVSGPHGNRCISTLYLCVCVACRQTDAESSHQSRIWSGHTAYYRWPALVIDLPPPNQFPILSQPHSRHGRGTTQSEARLMS